jgi:hypothetical protein
MTTQMTQTTVDALVSIGCREWSKNGMSRVYVPVTVSCAAIRLRVSYYDSGNVSSAMLNGEHVSNATARQMLADLDGMYYDAVADKFVGSHYGVAAALRARFAPSEAVTP